jgi:hypothetical protein
VLRQISCRVFRVYVRILSVSCSCLLTNATFLWMVQHLEYTTVVFVDIPYSILFASQVLATYETFQLSLRSKHSEIMKDPPLLIITIVWTSKKVQFGHGCSSPYKRVYVECACCDLRFLTSFHTSFHRTTAQ